MRIVIGIIIFLILSTGISLSIYYSNLDSIQAAIEEYEDSDFIESITILKNILPTADYETSEKIYYYKCKAINMLAQELEKDYNEELTKISLENKNNPDFHEIKKELENDIQEINKKINGDLKIILTPKKSRIIADGKFYSEFIAKYRGSSLIEDLNFEELQKIEKTEPEKVINSMINFYNQYPNTNYLSSLIKMLFDHFQKNDVKLKDKEKILFDMIITYGKKFPTSPEINKIYISKGDNVNLRNSPGLEGNPIGKIKKDEILIQLEKSMDASQVGDVRDYWYRITSLGGTRGWIFGKFISPINLNSYKDNIIDEKWTIEEYFSEWSDSNTPKEWAHITNSNKSSISFIERGSKKIIQLNCPKNKTAGLYSRVSTTKSFSILSKVRFIEGDSTSIFSYVMGNGKVFQLDIKKDVIEISGRKIPIHTSDWHDYLLVSENGAHAKLLVDGEVVSGRIPPTNSSIFNLRGLYTLVSSTDNNSSTEMEYIKIK